MYSFFQNPHYAYRELVHRDVIQGRTYPGMTVSGEMLLFMVSRIFSIIENQDWSPAFSIVPRGITEEPVYIPAAPVETPVEEQPAIPLTLEEQRIALAEHIISELDMDIIDDSRVRITDEGVTISLSNIQFLADSTILPERERRELREIAPVLQAVPHRRLLITGHTALAGTPEGRMQISTERAQAVKDYLVYLGVRRDDEITVMGMGAQRPIADNSTVEGMAQNRRVEITILED
jgi:outer membrane protein OmpA-like peptidoglycan-associated protein